MSCESRNYRVYFVISYANISDRNILSTDFLPSLSLPSSFLSIYVALWVPFLCPVCSRVEQPPVTLPDSVLQCACILSCTSNKRSFVFFISLLPVLGKQPICLPLICENEYAFHIEGRNKTITLCLIITRYHCLVFLTLCSH